jgi:hypothetical protein
MNSDFLTSLAFHGRGGPIPPLLELFCPAPSRRHCRHGSLTIDGIEVIRFHEKSPIPIAMDRELGGCGYLRLAMDIFQTGRIQPQNRDGFKPTGQGSGTIIET